MKKRDKWIDSFREASSEVSQWRENHPRATFNEIENSVDEKLAQIRKDMIQDLIEESKLRDFKELPPEERPKCPVCGRMLASNGKQKRQLITQHEQIVELERSKGHCSHCRVSFFPPG